MKSSQDKNREDQLKKFQRIIDYNCIRENSLRFALTTVDYFYEIQN